VSTTVPVQAGTGMFWFKTGNSARRYVGSFVTNASAQVLRFFQRGNIVRYQTYFTAVNGGTQTTYTSFSVDSYVGPTADSTHIQGTIGCQISGNSIYIGNDGTNTLGIATGTYYMSQWSEMPNMPLITRSLWYKLQGSVVNSAGSVYVVGYTFSR
jgi:hypothetical protein